MQKILFIVSIIFILGGAVFYFSFQRGADKEEINKIQDYEWRVKADMPTPRSKMAAAVLNDKIYVVGGLDAQGRTSTIVEVYNPKTDTWDRAPDLPEGCYLCSAVSLREKLYLVGGFEGLDFQLKADVFEFDPATQEWTRKSSLPTPRGAFGIGIWNDNIFVVGGVVPDSLPKETQTIPLQSGPFTFRVGLAVSGEIIMYDIASDQWKTKTILPTKRHSLAVSIIRGLLYAAGGREQVFARNFDALEIYDLKTDVWNNGPSMLTGRGTVGSVAVNDLLVVVGGEEGERRVFNEVEAYDLQEEKWIRLPKLSVPRQGLAVVALGNYIYAIGGSTEAQLATVNSVSSRNEVLGLEQIENEQYTTSD